MTEKRKNKFREWFPVFVMMAPGLIYLFINNYMPLPGLILAFKKMKFRSKSFIQNVVDSEWVGLDNFRYLFAGDAWLITRNTILYNLTFIIVNTIVGILIAILISEVKNKKAKTLYQSSVLLPFLLSYVIVSYIVFAFLGGDYGLVNRTILPALGKESINWYQEPKYWPFIIVFVNMWKSIGYGCLIYISAIGGIDTEYYEAAALDGAGKIKQIIHCTLPALIPSVITMTLLNVGRIFYSDFSLFFQVPRNSGPLLEITNVLDTYIYRGLMQGGQIGHTAAAGFYQSLVGFSLVMFSNWLVKKISPDNALF